VTYYKIHEAQVVALNPIYDTARQTSIPPMKYIADLGFVSARLMAWKLLLLCYVMLYIYLISYWTIILLISPFILTFPTYQKDNIWWKETWSLLPSTVWTLSCVCVLGISNLRLTAILYYWILELFPQCGALYFSDCLLPFFCNEKSCTLSEFSVDFASLIDRWNNIKNAIYITI
jgi:hypothetical protein